MSKIALLYGNFLYFPEDKTAYIPAAVEFLIILILCFLAFNFIRKISRKQELKAKVLEERILRERNETNQRQNELK